MADLFQSLLFAHINGLLSGLSVEAFEAAVKDGKNTIELMPQLPKYILSLANLDKIDYWADEAVKHIERNYPLHYKVLLENPSFIVKQKRLVREYLTH